MIKILPPFLSRLLARKTKVTLYATRRGPYYSLFRVSGQTTIDGVCVETFSNHVGLITNDLFPETAQGDIIKFTIETDSKSVGRETI